MPDVVIEQPAPTKAPWHLWVVGVLSLFWNASGAYVFVQAQSGAAMDMDATEIAYYAELPVWAMVLTGITFATAILGAITLLLRSRWSPILYLLSIGTILASTAADIARGSALLLQSQDWLVLAGVTTGLAVLQWLYARAMGKSGALR